MKVCIIHGSPRKGNTQKATEIFKDNLKQLGDYEFEEYHLPKDLPHFCAGCYQCIDRSEVKCPHASFTMPIAKAMTEADGIILTSPVYCLAESGAMKAFLDHFGYFYITHRPREEMFKKISLVISTAAGAGTGKSNKTMARSLKHWGVLRVNKIGLGIWAKEWREMKAEKQQKFEKLLKDKAQTFHKQLNKRDKLHLPSYTKMFYTMIRKMLLGFEDGNVDKEYWREKGWLDRGIKPFR